MNALANARAAKRPQRGRGEAGLQQIDAATIASEPLERLFARLGTSNAGLSESCFRDDRRDSCRGGRMPVEQIQKRLLLRREVLRPDTGSCRP